MFTGDFRVIADALHCFRLNCDYADAGITLQHPELVGATLAAITGCSAYNKICEKGENNTMEKSMMNYNARLRNEGVKDGIARGLQDGIAKGKTEGLQDGIAKGKAKGKTEIAMNRIRAG